MVGVGMRMPKQNIEAVAMQHVRVEVNISY